MSLICRFNAPGVKYSHTYTETPDQRNFERHCHEGCELLYVIKGEGKYVVEGTEYLLRPNTLLIIRPYEFHYVCPDRSSVYDRHVIHFDSDIPIDVAAELSILSTAKNSRHGVYIADESVTTRIGVALSEMESALRALGDSANASVKQLAFLQASLSNMLLWGSLVEPQGGLSDGEALVSRLIEHLNLHLTEEISLDRLAQSFFVSKYYLCHAFRKQTGVSVYSYVTTKRIAMARHLLASGEAATAVAYRVGFRNYSAFYRAFCKQTGQAPVHRRESNEKGENGMRIRVAEMGELDRIMEIYAEARAFMRLHGNPEQWGESYPPREMIREDINAGNCRVCEDAEGIAGVFYYAVGEDPTYRRIEDGEWLNERPYGVIHRIASAKHRRGVASFCFAWALGQCGNLRIDTHRDNLPMQQSLAKNGFVRCGTVYLEDGDARIAYQKAME